MKPPKLNEIGIVGNKFVKVIAVDHRLVTVMSEEDNSQETVRLDRFIPLPPAPSKMARPRKAPEFATLSYRQAVKAAQRFNRL